LIVEVDALATPEDALSPDFTRLILRGAGIESAQRLSVRGLGDAFWRWRQCQQSAMPRGIDLVLVQGTRIAAIPRSSRIEREA
jgi:alpha-D-ribose 1-methylphosphonate 5-triphosphate synthase subunit PhnH